MATIVSASQYGNYVKCENDRNGEKSGFVLTNKCDFSSHMISIIIVLSDEMLQQIDEIKVYDIENQIAQYIDGTVRQINYLFFELESEEQELKVCLGKKQPYTDKLEPVPMKVLYFEKIKITEPEYEKKNSCHLCSKKMNKLEHMTSCKHFFHNKCLWNYLEKNKLTKKTKCNDICDHGDKVGFFPCPVCKFVQYGSRIF